LGQFASRACLPPSPGRALALPSAATAAAAIMMLRASASASLPLLVLLLHQQRASDASASPAPPPASWRYTNCSACVGAGLLWCYYDDQCWSYTDPGDRKPQTCALNPNWCAAGSRGCRCTTCGDTRCQPPAPAPNPSPAPQRTIQQVHLALGKTPGSMTASWTTATSSSSPGVQYGPAGGALRRNAAGDQRALNISGSRYTHVATLVGLVPGLKYDYRVVGDTVTFHFTFRRNGGQRTGPDRHIIFGDLGASHAFSLCDACTAGTTNCEAAACTNRTAGLVSEVETADMMLHVGDFAYDFDGDGGKVGDQFMRNVEQVAAYVPYMVSHGNHENSAVSSACCLQWMFSEPVVNRETHVS
jgi:hypothetical protein